MPLSVHIVTAEREVLAEEGVDEVVAPGSEGEFTVLPQHAPLLTMINPGIMRVIKGSEEIDMAITGGFLEVRDDRVTILADAVERSDEIDEARAEQARRAAELSLREKVDVAGAQAALSRALLRLKVVERRRRRSPRSGGPRAPMPPGS